MEFKIPEEIQKSIDIKFLKQLHEELHCIFGISLDMFEMNDIFQKESTTGFAVAFLNACKKLKKENLVKYVRSLDWADNDLFDDYLIDRMKEEKLILPGDEELEIERQLGIPNLEVYDCCECGKFFRKEDVIQLKDEETGELISACECKNCLNVKKVEPLLINRKQAILEHLNVKESDIFFCELCKKYYLKRWKKKEICHYCEIMKHSHKHNNSYFLRARNLGVKWSKNIK